VQQIWLICAIYLIISKSAKLVGYCVEHIMCISFLRAIVQVCSEKFSFRWDDIVKMGAELHTMSSYRCRLFFQEFDKNSPYYISGKLIYQLPSFFMR
jgi:hypothetical protein